VWKNFLSLIVFFPQKLIQQSDVHDRAGDQNPDDACPQAAKNDGGWHREMAGLVPAHLANHQITSKVELALTSTNPTMYFHLAKLA
jgi:hypothetical protein